MVRWPSSRETGESGRKQEDALVFVHLRSNHAYWSMSGAILIPYDDGPRGERSMFSKF